MFGYLAARTEFFDRVVVSALQRGVTQVVIAAAGYDGRALRYAKPGVRWFEVDHPATQADKIERLARLGLPAPQIAFVAADFAVDDVATGLAGADHRAETPTLFLCEGVAVYLEMAVLERLLRALRSRAAAGSRLAINLSVGRRPGRAPASASRPGSPPWASRSAPCSPRTAAGELLAATGWRDGGRRGARPAPRTVDARRFPARAARVTHPAPGRVLEAARPRVRRGLRPPPTPGRHRGRRAGG